MAFAVSSLLAKVAILERQAERLQPIDYLATLSPDQVIYYRNWFSKFKAANSETPDALYAATISCTKWTPLGWLPYPRITTDMTIAECAEIWREQIGH